MSVITSTMVKTYLKIAATVTNDDALLADIINKVEQMFKIATQLDLEQAAYTEYYNGDGTDMLLLRHYPVSAITALYDDTDRVYGADTEISSEDFVLDENAGIIRLDGLTFAQGLKNIKVVYTAGHSPVPEDIQLALIQLTVADYLEVAGAVNVVEGQDFIYKPAKLRSEAEKVINSRRRIV